MEFKDVLTVAFGVVLGAIVLSLLKGFLRSPSPEILEIEKPKELIL